MPGTLVDGQIRCLVEFRLWLHSRLGHETFGLFDDSLRQARHFVLLF